MKTLIILCLLLNFSHNQVNCSIRSSISSWFGDIVDDMVKGVFDHAGELIEKAKQAFIEAMDTLFDQKLIPLISQIDSMIHRNLGQIDEIIQKTIDNFKISVIEIVNNAAKQAKELIGQTIEDIKKKIIDNFFEKVTELEGKVVSDIILILNRIDETIYKLSCFAQSIEIRIRDDLTKSLSFIPNPFNRCRIAIDKLFPGHYLRWKPLFWYAPNELYELKKCYLISPLTETTPIKSVLMAYRDLEFLAAEMRCLSIAFGASMNLKYYVMEMGRIADVIDTFEDIYNTTDSSSKKKLQFLESK